MWKNTVRVAGDRKERIVGKVNVVTKAEKIMCKRVFLMPLMIVAEDL